MITKKIISVFLLLVLSIQLLPLKQTIAWLLGGQATEELVHADADGKVSRAGDDLNKDFLPVYHPTLIQSILISGHKPVPHQCEGLEGRHADDILTPPPNC
ncbi:hypothetical protein [Flavitalea sp. BT771]|uniref:hypothetical protein n=1 Tax=Flavitalea sp. BT771 TaxID=3063329 RepID=UPI0026E432B2|nr:hypothetical protein [Flavitalea sp. BT771]